MRLFEIAAKISKQDAKLILHDVDTAKGNIAKIMDRRPQLRALSQEWALDNLGNRFTVFRAVGVTDSLRQEGVVSTSTDFKVALGIAGNFPVLMGSTETVVAKPHILSYNVGVNDVVAYVPLLVGIATEVLGAGIDGTSIRSVRGGKTPVSAVIDASTEERELIVDVSSVSPRVISFSQGIDGKYDMHLLKMVYDGSYTGPEAFINYKKENSSGVWMPGGWSPGASREQYSELYAQELRNVSNLAKEYQQFFK